MHGEQARHFFVAPGARVLYFVAGLEYAGVDAQKHRLAALVHGDLEGQGAEGRAILGRPRGGLARDRIDPGDGGNFRRRGQKVANGVEQWLHAFVAQGRSSQHGHDGAGDGGLAQGRDDGRTLDRPAFEVGGGDGVVEIRRGLDELVARGRHRLGHGRRHAVLARWIVLGAGEIEGAFADEIHDAGELIFRADG